MLRRSFLLSSLFGFVPFIPKPKVESSFGLGEYKSHKVEIRDCLDYNEPLASVELESGVRYVRFPIENILTIEYEKGIESYYAFNLKKDTMKKMNEMTGQELLSHTLNEGMDNYTPRIEVDKKKFCLGSVTYRG